MKKLRLLIVFILITASGFAQDTITRSNRGSAYRARSLQFLDTLNTGNVKQDLVTLNSAGGTEKISSQALINWFIKQLEGYGFTGTRAGDDLIVTLGDYDNSGTGAKLIIDTNDGLARFEGLSVISDDLVGIKNDSGNFAHLRADNLTDTHTYQLPDAPGTLLTQSELAGYETLTGSQDKANTAEQNAIDYARSFGLGDGTLSLATGSDANTITKTGFYRFGNLNTPNAPTTDRGYMIVTVGNQYGYFQSNIWMTDTGRLFFRSRITGTWSDWVEAGVGTSDGVNSTYVDNGDTSTLSQAQSYSDGLAGNYATAAQGVKADNSLQKTGGAVTGDVNFTSRIGINTPTPKALLHLVAPGSNPEASPGVGSNAVSITGEGGLYYAARQNDTGLTFVMGASATGVAFLGSLSNDDVELRTHNSTLVTLKDSTSYVGIGERNPKEKLDVKGNAIADTLFARNAMKVGANKFTSGDVAKWNAGFGYTDTKFTELQDYVNNTFLFNGDMSVGQTNGRDLLDRVAELEYTVTSGGTGGISEARTKAIADSVAIAKTANSLKTTGTQTITNGKLDIDNGTTSSSRDQNSLVFRRPGASYIYQAGIGGTLNIKTSNTASNDTQAMTFASDGTVTVDKLNVTSDFAGSGMIDANAPPTALWNAGGGYTTESALAAKLVATAGKYSNIQELLDNNTAPDGAVYTVLGFYAPGDWGPPISYVWRANSTATTNGGTIRKATGISGDGRYEALVPKTWKDLRWYGATSGDGTDDEAAFNNAISSMPNGGEINIEGEFNGTSFNIDHSNITLSGTGTLKSETGTPLFIAPYRYAGWSMTASTQIRYTEQVEKGQHYIIAYPGQDLSNYVPGVSFNLTGGSAYLDTTQAEPNIVEKVVGDTIYMKYNLAEDYRIQYASWGGLTTAEATPAAPGQTFTLEANTSGFVAGRTLTIGDENDSQLFEMVSISGNIYTLRNIDGVQNSGNVIPSGSKIYKGRSLILTPSAVQNTVLRGITLEGKGKIVSISNTINTLFEDVTILNHRLTTDNWSFWLDGDGGRDFKMFKGEVRNDNFNIAQFARGFTDITMDDVDFYNAGLEFTEFAKSYQVSDCFFDAYDERGDLTGYLISVGKSSADADIHNNTMRGHGLRTAIYTQDIQGQESVGSGFTSIYENKITMFASRSIMDLVYKTGHINAHNNHMYGDVEYVVGNFDAGPVTGFDTGGPIINDAGRPSWGGSSSRFEYNDFTGRTHAAWASRDMENAKNNHNTFQRTGVPTLGNAQTYKNEGNILRSQGTFLAVSPFPFEFIDNTFYGFPLYDNSVTYNRPASMYSHFERILFIQNDPIGDIDEDTEITLPFQN
ncbi:MAG: pyocin knob domain-containing protein [Leeuwenhoekiella sp.]